MNPSTWGDNVRAALIAVVTNLLSTVVLLGFVHLDTEQLAALNVLTNSVVTMLFLVFKGSNHAS
jgi:hypothetical protein